MLRPAKFAAIALCSVALLLGTSSQSDACIIPWLNYMFYGPYASCGYGGCGPSYGSPGMYQQSPCGSGGCAPVQSFYQPRLRSCGPLCGPGLACGLGSPCGVIGSSCGAPGGCQLSPAPSSSMSSGSPTPVDRPVPTPVDTPKTFAEEPAKKSTPAVPEEVPLDDSGFRPRRKAPATDLGAPETEAFKLPIQTEENKPAEKPGKSVIADPKPAPSIDVFDETKNVDPLPAPPAEKKPAANEDSVDVPSLDRLDGKLTWERPFVRTRTAIYVNFVDTQIHRSKVDPRLNADWVPVSSSQKVAQK